MNRLPSMRLSQWVMADRPNPIEPLYPAQSDVCNRTQVDPPSNEPTDDVCRIQIYVASLRRLSLSHEYT
jgi:hypothetical protein